MKIDRQGSCPAAALLILALLSPAVPAAEDGTPETPAAGEASGESVSTETEGEQAPEPGARDDAPGFLIRRKLSGEEYRIPDPCRPWQGGELRAWDRTHHWISRTLCWPGQWFDGFFADPDEDIYRSGTWVRVVGSQRWQDDDQEVNEVEVDASAELPHAERRLRLIFASDDKRQSEEDTAQEDPRAGGVDADEPSGFRTALRVALRATRRMKLDVDVGLRSELLGTFSIRGRWRRALAAGWFGRISERVFWEDPDGWGWTNKLDFDRPLNESLNLRFTSEAELTEENNELNRDWFLSQNATLFWKYSRRTGISFNVGANGYTDPVAAVQTWYTSIRFRRNIWRPWLFYEIQPFAFWPRSDDYHGVSGITLRLETQFGLY